MVGMVGPSTGEAGGNPRTSLSKPSISSTSRVFYLLRDLAKTVLKIVGAWGTVRRIAMKPAKQRGIICASSRRWR